LEGIAQACEDVLAAMRDGKLPARIGAEATLAAVATTRRILRGIATTGVEPPGDDSALIARLTAAMTGEHTASSRSVPTRIEPPSPGAIPAVETDKVAPSVPPVELAAS